jgi:DNA polymerase-3 subunit epsilon
MGKYAVVDVETLGLTPFGGSCPGLVSVACAVLDDELNIVSVRSWKVAVSVESALQAHPKAIEVNGWTPEGWADAMDLPDVLAELYVDMENKSFVAHNVTFDLRWVEAAFKAAQMEMPWMYRPLCTMSMAFPLKMMGAVPSTSLDDVSAWAGVRRETDVHNAEEDVRITAEVFRKLCGK